AFIATALGIIGFAIAAALAFLRARTRAADVQSRFDGEIGELRAALDRAETLLDAQDQVMMVWSVEGSPPEVIGRSAVGGGLPSDPKAIAAFGTWLDHASSATLEAAVTKLRRSGSAFSMTLATRNGNYVEAIGRTVGGRAVLRPRDVTGDQLQTARIADRHDRLKRDIDVMRTLLEGLPMPAWLRDQDGALVWVNKAYARAVDLADAKAVISENAELLDAAGREALRKARQIGGVARQRLAVVVAGARRSFDVVYLSAEDGSAGIATDVSELESIESQLKRTIDFHARTLDQLATAVTIFSADGRLRFYNAAYKTLFDLETTFLESTPEEGAIYDRLRSARRLPEQADYQSWKASLLEAYRSLEPSEHWWHLPDGQTLRVLSTPHPQGGVIRVYENVTERLDLESRYQSLANVQQESLDNLSEGVVVFGSDGRVSLRNPAFERIWKLSAKELDDRPHFSRIVDWCRLIHDDADVWSALSAAVTGFDDMRPTLKGRMERIDGSVVDYATVPLPDGATMITFLDVSATVAVERALKEKNEALQAADHLKNAFVEHVSYELRSPLT
ncbi:MAG: PAS-domain containing protein, partial [Hyphomicrobiales bacterium]|nr:PAS-domain containing protein [Hyphomicrobiales bacterium]